jgi:hypothetical protein
VYAQNVSAFILVKFTQGLLSVSAWMQCSHMSVCIHALCKTCTCACIHQMCQTKDVRIHVLYHSECLRAHALHKTTYVCACTRRVMCAYTPCINYARVRIHMLYHNTYVCIRTPHETACIHACIYMCALYQADEHVCMCVRTNKIRNETCVYARTMFFYTYVHAHAVS